MPARLSRRTLLAGLAAMPTLALVGCDDDRTTAGPISTAGTLDFANRLRIPALAESTVDDHGVRIFRPNPPLAITHTPTLVGPVMVIF